MAPQPDYSTTEFCDIDITFGTAKHFGTNDGISKFGLEPHCRPLQLVLSLFHVLTFFVFYTGTSTICSFPFLPCPRAFSITLKPLAKCSRKARVAVHATLSDTFARHHWPDLNQF